MAETEIRPVRMCDSCGGVDDHPRHVVAYADGEAQSDLTVAAKALANTPPEHLGEILAQIQDKSVLQKHMDCCREDGCPDGTCDEVTKGAEDKRGNALVKHLVALSPKEA